MIKNLYILSNGKFVAFDHNRKQINYLYDEWHKMKKIILKQCTQITIIDDYSTR